MQFLLKKVSKTLIHSQQTRQFRYAPKWLKGKMYMIKLFEKHLEDKKKRIKRRHRKRAENISEKSDLARQKRLSKLPPPNERWTPKSPFDELFKKIYKHTVKGSTRVTFSPFHELIKLASNKAEVRRLMLLFHQMVIRKFQFTTETSKLLIDKLTQRKRHDLLNEMIANSVLIHLPFSRDTFFNYMETLLKEGKDEQVFTHFGLLVEGKVNGFKEQHLYDFWKLSTILDLEKEQHCEKMMEFYEKFKKPLVPLEGFYSEIYIMRLADYLQKVKVASEKVSKDTEKIAEDFSKYQQYIPKQQQTSQ